MNNNQNGWPFFKSAVPLNLKESSQRQPPCLPSESAHQLAISTICINVTDTSVGLPSFQLSVSLNIKEASERQPNCFKITTHSNPSTYADSRV